MQNSLLQILSPNPQDDGVWIHQKAWFHMGNFDAGSSATYNLHERSNGVYAFIIEGTATINGQSLESRDGLGLWDIDQIEIVSDSDSKILFMEVPMQVQ